MNSIAKIPEREKYLLQNFAFFRLSVNDCDLIEKNFSFLEMRDSWPSLSIMMLSTPHTIKKVCQIYITSCEEDVEGSNQTNVELLL